MPIVKLKDCTINSTIKKLELHSQQAKKLLPDQNTKSAKQIEILDSNVQIVKGKRLSSLLSLNCQQGDFTARDDYDMSTHALEVKDEATVAILTDSNTNKSTTCEQSPCSNNNKVKCTKDTSYLRNYIIKHGRITAKLNELNRKTGTTRLLAHLSPTSITHSKSRPVFSKSKTAKVAYRRNVKKPTVEEENRKVKRSQLLLSSREQNSEAVSCILQPTASIQLGKDSTCIKKRKKKKVVQSRASFTKENIKSNNAMKLKTGRTDKNSIVDHLQRQYNHISVTGQNGTSENDAMKKSREGDKRHIESDKVPIKPKENIVPSNKATNEAVIHQKLIHSSLIALSPEISMMRAEDERKHVFSYSATGEDEPMSLATTVVADTYNYNEPSRLADAQEFLKIDNDSRNEMSRIKELNNNPYSLKNDNPKVEFNSPQHSIEHTDRIGQSAALETFRRLAANNTKSKLQHHESCHQPSKQGRPVSLEISTHFNHYAPHDDCLSIDRATCVNKRASSVEDNRRYYHHLLQQQQTDQCYSNNTQKCNYTPASLLDTRNHNPIHRHSRDSSSSCLSPVDCRTSLNCFECTKVDSPCLYHNRSSSIQAIDGTADSFRLHMEGIQYQQSSSLDQRQDASSHEQGGCYNCSCCCCYCRNSGSRMFNQAVVKRKDSAKSLSSVSSMASPSVVSCNSIEYEELKSNFEKAKATINALQKQKKACNKDVLFLAQNVDKLTLENLEWKKKYKTEKKNKERFQDDLSDTMDKLNEAVEHIRQLDNQTRVLKSEIDEKNKTIYELEKKAVAPPITMRTKEKDKDLLAAQLHHSQNQVQLLKATMEQFLRMGVFNVDRQPNATSSFFITSPTTSINEFKRERTHPHRITKLESVNSKKSSTTNSVTTEDSLVNSEQSTSPSQTIESASPTIESSSVVNKSSSSIKKHQTNENSKSVSAAELNNQLFQLLREKEILQAEYNSKAPSTGGKALMRRRREELESRLDALDSQMCRIKLRMRNYSIL
ncbi:MAG: hypothetical protein EXX96DRAFT_256190 [Benjaminiella poitrasii]|nr:MAG: hypothetical protein EXX96DRAFT_256190 [Benjaminiella poitrasii]